MSAIFKLARPMAAAAGFAVLAGAMPALAADAIVDVPPAPAAPMIEAPVASWAGPYAGVQLGYGFSGRTETPAGDLDTDGFIGGGFAGYNFQNGMFVYGGEVDLNYANLESDVPGVSSKTSLDGSLRARIGVAATDNILVYGTAGGAAQSLKVSDGFGSDRNTLLGWTAGAGVDVKVTENIFARAEYRYTDFGSKDFNTGSGEQSISSRDNRVMFGLGVKF